MSNSGFSKKSIARHQTKFILMFVIALTQWSCTKSRKAELPDDLQGNILPISIFLSPTESSTYFVEKAEGTIQSEAGDLKALHVNSSQRVSMNDVQVPGEVKFMFENLPLVTQVQRDFKVTFSIDREHITAYKVVESGQVLTTFEKNIALTAHEAELISNLSRSTELNVVTTLVNQLNSAKKQRQEIISGKRNGAVLVPLFKYPIASFGVVERAKNELKEDTSVLKLKETEWSSATHIQIRAKTDARQVVGLIPGQIKELDVVFEQSKLDQQKMLFSTLSESIKSTFPQLKNDAVIYTRLDNGSLNIYELTEFPKLSKSEQLVYNLKNNKSEQIINCALTSELTRIIQPKDSQCVLVRRGFLPIKYLRVELTQTDKNGATSAQLRLTTLPKTESVGLISIEADQEISEVKYDLNIERELQQTFDSSEIDGQKFTAEELGKKYKLGLKFLDPQTTIFTRLDDNSLYIFEMTSILKLTETQKRLLKNDAAQGQIFACSDKSIPEKLQSADKDCVMVRVARVPVEYVSIEHILVDSQNLNSGRIITKRVPKNSADAKVQIAEHSAAQQLEVTQSLDPDSTIKVADIQGEFLYRRTFEDASNMFLGRTGTSGDMSIVKFELEDERLVVRNQQSLIKYTGQGAKDREEIMSIPVKYYVLEKENANGVALVTPVLVETKKEKAQYIKLNWTANTIPNASSPLAFFDGGDCFMSNTSQKVTDMDMRLKDTGILNFSLSGSYTMRPTTQCISVKDVNSAYWAGSYQFNYNVKERISFRRHAEPIDDEQFTLNISHMAQAAFNFGFFTIADRVTEDGQLINRDGSEKYMPIVHDFRNNKTITYHLGGLATAATSPERRKFLFEAAKQVVAEWNATFAISFKGTNLERTDLKKYPYLRLELDDKNEGRLGDLDRNYIWFNELEAENGLLGVAQPAANPRSGKAMAANVIVYTGNTEDQARRLVKITSLARAYEKQLSQIQQMAIEQMTEENSKLKSNPEGSSDGQPMSQTKNDNSNSASQGKTVNSLISNTKVQNLTDSLAHDILALTIKDKKQKNIFKFAPMARLGLNQKKQLNAETFRKIGKGEDITLENKPETFIKNLVALALDKKLSRSPKELELAVNNAFIRYGPIKDESVLSELQSRSEKLAMAIRFDEKNKFRPGCFMYAREDVNDANLVYKKDDKGNEVLDFDESVKTSFRRAVMSTLSHELGHGFGLMHNFKGSTDSDNFEFSAAEKTGRNYSSIMDYMSDAEMAYHGPGPYDAHAIRAGYTGYVELSQEFLASVGNMKAVADSKITLVNGNLIHIADLMKLSGRNSFVHVTKDTFNKPGFIKHYNQCDDMGQGETILCATFDYGSSATEIVQNKIADYKRSYVSNYYVADKIKFNFEQKIAVLKRNIGNFQSIRSYLDETINTFVIGTGRPADVSVKIRQDLVRASTLGYQFFHELIRNPEAKGISAGIESIGRRVKPIKYSYLGNLQQDADNKNCTKNEESELICTGIKILEGKSLYDKPLEAKSLFDKPLDEDDENRQKMDTFGILYDKLFALQFLLQPSSANLTDDSQQSKISFIDFEQFFMGVSDPADSLTLRSIRDIITGDLKIGFFAPSGAFVEDQRSLEVNRDLGDQALVQSIIGLFQSKWKDYDVFAEAFKVGRSRLSQAPADRYNVVRLGQSRQASDSRVFYAAQNAVASASIIKNAARTELLIDHSNEIFATMKLMFEADQPANAAIKILSDKFIAESCVVNESDKQPIDPTKCKLAREKPQIEFVKENPEIAQLRLKGDEIMLSLLKQIRELNESELILQKKLDVPDFEGNLLVVVQSLRNILNLQLPFILNSLKHLQSVAPGKLTDAFKVISQELRPLAQANSKLNDSPLALLTLMFISQQVNDIEVELQNKLVFTGKEFTDAMMPNANNLKTELPQMKAAIEKLSLYTGLIDPDAIGN